MSKRINEFDDDIYYNTRYKKHKVHKTNINYRLTDLCRSRVYKALKGKMGGELHALALETKIKSN